MHSTILCLVLWPLASGGTEDPLAHSPRPSSGTGGVGGMPATLAVLGIHARVRGRCEGDADLMLLGDVRDLIASNIKCHWPFGQMYMMSTSSSIILSQLTRLDLLIFLQGLPVHLMLWSASIIFLAANTFIIVHMLRVLYGSDAAESRKDV